jgi:hypothetical protein
MKVGVDKDADHGFAVRVDQGRDVGQQAQKDEE